MNESKNFDSICQSLLATNTFDNVYTKSVTLEGELYTAKMQVAASKTNYKKI